MVGSTLRPAALSPGVLPRVRAGGSAPRAAVASARPRAIPRSRWRPTPSGASSSFARIADRDAPLLPRPARRRPRRRPSSAPLAPRAIGRLFGGGQGGEGGDGSSSSSSSSSSGNVFAAKKRSAVRVPGVVVSVAPSEATSREAEIESLVAAGVSAVILSAAEADGTPATTRELFDAALILKTALRRRAALLVADRADIAASAEADGVVIGDDGVPVVVARKSMGGPGVVACAVRDADAALVAAKEGADVVLAPDAATCAAVEGKLSVPVFALVDAEATASVADAEATAEALAEAGARGVWCDDPFAVPAAPGAIEAALGAFGKRLGDAGRDEDAGDDGTNAASAAASSDASAGDPAAAASNRAGNVPVAPRPAAGGLAGKLIDGAALEVLERERSALDRAVAFLETAAPALEEIDLLVEARKGLEELFLLVIVGEFNAGKSSVINAVLGEKHLKEGILPTTNEITVLRHGDVARTERSSDGFFTQFVPADVLREVNIVDTPGTNVILERQQRLTEEFVPRADLVLFVLSADRPMTESEVRFLKYIKRWGKKVLFVVNKCDRLDDESQVEEVRQFVADNAERLLGVSDPAVMPVSAKDALAAKLRSEPLAPSGFDALEDYVLSFLGGSSSSSSTANDRGGEGMRLKLGTPLQVATLLFDAAEGILASERRVAVAELDAATGVATAMEGYEAAMRADFAAQLDAVRACVLRATDRADDLLDDTLRLSNAADLFTTYVLGDGGGRIRAAYRSAVLGDAEAELRAALAEHTGWLARNNERQLEAYAEAVRQRGFDPSETDLSVQGIIRDEDEVEREAAKVEADFFVSEKKGEFEEGEEEGSEEGSTTLAEEEGSTLADALAGERPVSNDSESVSSSSLVKKLFEGTVSPLAVAAGFDNRSAAILLEREVRDAVYATVGAAGTSFLVAVFLSGFLDSLAEDVLAFSLTAAVGYVSVLSLPLKRAEAKGKVKAAAEAYLGEVEAAMRAEFERKVDAATRQVNAHAEPWVRRATEEEREAAENQKRRDALQEELEKIGRDVQSL